MKDQGYVCDLYTERPRSFTEERQVEGLADNLDESTYSLNVVKIPLQLFRLSLLKSAPLALKNTFWLHPELLSYTSIGILESGVHPWVCDDPLFYRELVSKRLEPTSEEPCFKFYHLWGFHWPWDMTADAVYIKEGTEFGEQFKGDFFILQEFFNQLKELGLYKDATIIIVGDHPHHLGWRQPAEPRMIGCFVKLSGAEGTPIKYSNAPVSIENIRATCVEAAGGDTAPWGQTFSEVGEDDLGERYYYNRYVDENGKYYMAVFRVIGDANEGKNWALVELVPFDVKNWH
jgi:hypothetical protein